VRPVQLAWIFWINVPVALICGYLGWRMLKRFETKTSKLPIDRVGLILMVVWVAALQLMLDEGKKRTGSPPPKSCCWP
jgi:DHA2 family multidrug resistance protein